MHQCPLLSVASLCPVGSYKPHHHKGASICGCEVSFRMLNVKRKWNASSNF